MMLSRTALKPRKRNAARPAEKSAPQFLAWLRGRECFLAGHRAGGCGLGSPPRKSPVEAAHIDHGGDKGMSSKVSDKFAIPLCQRHHDEQSGKIGEFRQRGGWRTFEIKYGFDAVDVAGDYWHLWPQRHAWERKLSDG
jgi:hypothetical protein